MICAITIKTALTNLVKFYMCLYFDGRAVFFRPIQLKYCYA
jgi:hypothetical protein